MTAGIGSGSSMTLYRMNLKRCNDSLVNFTLNFTCYVTSYNGSEYRMNTEGLFTLHSNGFYI